MAPDVLAHVHQFAVRGEEAGGVQPAGAGEAGLAQALGQVGEQGAVDRRPGRQTSQWTATSSSAPLPHTPHEDVV